jgi:hypothetical protein
VAGKGYRRVNTMQILYIHICKCKNDTCETIPGIGIGGEGGEVKYDILDTV